MLGPKFPIRERILAVGPSGAGKSTATLDIANKIPEMTMFVMDAEPGGAWVPDGGRMNPGNALANIRPRDATDWESFAAAAKDFRAQGGVNDWLVVDLIGTAYEMVQSFYIEKVKGVRVDDFYEAFAEKRGKSKNALEGDTDWQYIGKMYHAVMSDILNFPGHVFGIAAVKPPPRAEYDDNQTAGLFRHLGVRPEGQKKLSNLFSTILFFKEVRQGMVHEWQFTTVRERNPKYGPQRQYVENKAWGDFAKAYLWEVVGWRPGK